MIDLQQAKFCVNCEAIYTEQVCPRCLSECFLWISSVVGTILKEKIEYGALQSGFFSSYFPRKPWRTWQTPSTFHNHGAPGMKTGRTHPLATPTQSSWGAISGGIYGQGCRRV